MFGENNKPQPPAPAVRSRIFNHSHAVPYHDRTPSSSSEDIADTTSVRVRQRGDQYRLSSATSSVYQPSRPSSPAAEACCTKEDMKKAGECLLAWLCCRISYGNR